MNQYEFIATMVGHLTWPVMTLIIIGIVLLRLRWVLSFIKDIKYKDLELSIREELTEARVVAESLEAERDPAQLSNTEPDKISRLVEIDQSIAIIEIWRRLERQIIKLIQHNGFMRFMSPTKFVEYLVKIGKLSDLDLVLFRKLREIRNASVHAQSAEALSKGGVFEFERFVELLIGKLEAIRREPTYLNLPPELAKQVDQ